MSEVSRKRLQVALDTLEFIHCFEPDGDASKTVSKVIILLHGVAGLGKDYSGPSKDLSFVANRLYESDACRDALVILFVGQVAVRPWGEDGRGYFLMYEGEDLDISLFSRTGYTKERRWDVTTSTWLRLQKLLQAFGVKKEQMALVGFSQGGGSVLHLGLSKALNHGDGRFALLASLGQPGLLSLRANQLVEAGARPVIFGRAGPEAFKGIDAFKTKFLEDTAILKQQGFVVRRQWLDRGSHSFASIFAAYKEELLSLLQFPVRGAKRKGMPDPAGLGGQDLVAFEAFAGSPFPLELQLSKKSKQLFMSARCSICNSTVGRLEEKHNFSRLEKDMYAHVSDVHGLLPRGQWGVIYDCAVDPTTAYVRDYPPGLKKPRRALDSHAKGGG